MSASWVRGMTAGCFVARVSVVDSGWGGGIAVLVVGFGLAADLRATSFASAARRFFCASIRSFSCFLDAMSLLFVAIPDVMGREIRGARLLKRFARSTGHVVSLSEEGFEPARVGQSELTKLEDGYIGCP